MRKNGGDRACGSGVSRSCVDLRSAVRLHNASHIPRLANLLADHRVDGLIGAGSSIACGYPGWSRFVDKLEWAARRFIRPEYLRELRAKPITVRVDRVIQILGDDLHDLFKDTFDVAKLKEIPEWVSLLWNLNLGGLLTTNYTEELEEAGRRGCRALHSVGPPVEWWDAGAMNTALRNHGAPSVIHLHGHWKFNPDIRVNENGLHWSNIILGEKSYRYAYEKPGWLRDQLRALCSVRTLLIVGASLDDPDTARFVMR